MPSFVRNRLVAAGEVDNAESANAECDASFVKEPSVVRPSVGDAFRHPAKAWQAHSADDSADAAHQTSIGRVEPPPQTVPGLPELAAEAHLGQVSPKVRGSR